MDQKEYFELKNNLRNKLDEYIEELKDRYWERDKRFTIEDICFNENSKDPPRIFLDETKIKIYLSKSAQSYLQQAFFQLAHESVHLLSPCNLSEVLVVEEGMAVDYSLLKSECNYRTEALKHLKKYERNYKYSYEKFQEWRKLKPSIKRIHEEKPKISEWNVDILKKFTPSLSCDLARKLCTKFQCLPKQNE